MWRGRGLRRPPAAWRSRLRHCVVCSPDWGRVPLSRFADATGLQRLRAQNCAATCRVDTLRAAEHRMGAWILIAVMLAILAGAGYVAYEGWTAVEGPEMPTSMHVAMWLGVIFSILVGSGLM